MTIEEEMAANVEQPEVEDTAPVEQPTSPVEPVDQTKAFATRLKEEKAKAKLEAREEIAQQFGYSTWQEYADAQTNSKLIDKGYDPEEVRPFIKDLIKEDPEYQEAMKYKAEKEELEKEFFAQESIKALNDTFGTAYKNVNELDPETIKMWNEGTPLEKAFAANNWSKLQEMAVKKAAPVDNGKSHLTQVSGSNESSKTREVSKDELRVFKIFGIDEEAAKNYVKSHNN